MVRFRGPSAADRVDAVGPGSVSIDCPDSRLGQGEGLCSEACTADESVRSALSFRDASGECVNFTCRRISVGQ